MRVKAGPIGLEQAKAMGQSAHRALVHQARTKRAAGPPFRTQPKSKEKRRGTRERAYAAPQETTRYEPTGRAECRSSDVGSLPSFPAGVGPRARSSRQPERRGSPPGTRGGKRGPKAAGPAVSEGSAPHLLLPSEKKT